MSQSKTIVVHVLARTTVQQVEIPPTVPDAMAKGERRPTERSRKGSVHISPNSILRLTRDEWDVLRAKPELKTALRLVAEEGKPEPRPRPVPPPLAPAPPPSAEPTEGDEAPPEVAEEKPTEESPAPEAAPSEGPSSPDASRKRRGRRS